MFAENQKQAVFSEYPIDSISDAILTVATLLGFSVAIWKLPDTGIINLIVSFADDLEDEITRLFLPNIKGFIVNSFDSDHDGMILIRGDLRIIIENGSYILDIDKNADREKLTLFTDSLLSILRSPNEYVLYHARKLAKNLVCEEKQQFISFVNKGIEKINLGNLKKIIAARTKTLDINRSFSLSAVYRSLCQSYPNTFVSLVSHKKTGTWLGASPELLLRVDNDNIVHTVSLAGTKRKCGLGNNSDMVGWSCKEINEQALVTEFILSIFDRQGVNKYQASALKNYSVGDICHLKTELNINLNSEDNLNLDPTALIKELHPTSAICGMPRQTAFEFIGKYENFDRALYGGFLGPINYGDEINLYVNIRCMQFLDAQAVLYAGAGITHDSDPEKEWEETNLKCEMISKIVRGHVQ